ncbi:MAG: PadR family transcriptional regulator [Candidatus Bathyarchaeia archaeon]
MVELERDLIKATIRGFSRVIILWLLSRKPMSGYAITKELRAMTGWNMTAGVVYTLLYDLAEMNLIHGEWHQKGRRRVRVYSVTDKGCELLKSIRRLFKMPVKDLIKDMFF